jgi:hypothetical protein
MEQTITLPSGVWINREIEVPMRMSLSEIRCPTAENLMNAIQSITISNGQQSITKTREEMMNDTLTNLNNIDNIEPNTLILLRENMMSINPNVIDSNTTQEELRNRTYETLGICPITQEAIINKMTLSCGHYFEQSAILEWILNNQNNEGDSTCPTCRSIIVYNRPQPQQNNSLPLLSTFTQLPLRPARTRPPEQEIQTTLRDNEKEIIKNYMLEHGLFKYGQCCYIFTNVPILLEEHNHYFYHVFNSCYPECNVFFKTSFDPTHKNDIIRHLKKCVRTFAINPIQTSNPAVKEYIDWFESAMNDYIRYVVNVFTRDGLADVE